LTLRPALNSLFLLATLATLLLPASADAGRRKNPDVIEDALAYATTDRSKAIVLLEGAIAEVEDREAAARLYLYAAEQYRLNGNDAKSHRYFTKVVELVEKGADLDAARLGLTLLNLSSGSGKHLLDTLDDYSDKVPLETQNADRYLILAYASARVGDIGKATAYSRKALQYAEEDPAVARRVQAKLANLSKAPEQTEEAVIQVVETPKLDLGDQAEAALKGGDADSVNALADQIRARGDDGDELYAEYLVKRLDAAPVDAKTIAVLLPLSDKYEAVGRQIEEALSYGYDSRDRDLLLIDSGATPESAVAALESAVLNKGVIAVVGPLLTQETEAVTEAANALHVPLLSLSQALDSTDGLDWVFQGIVNVPAQVEALLDYSMGTRGFRSFCVFAPDNAYGIRATEAFVAGVEARGGQVTVQGSYDPAAKDMIPFAKKLGRKDYDARAVEFRELKRAADQAGRDPRKVVLPPVIDYEAMFIPDNANRLPLALAALAYEEFPMGDFQTSKDGPIIPLLGLSGWNNPILLSGGSEYARNSIFTDVYLGPLTIELEEEKRKHRYQPPESVVSFVEAYKSDLGRSPTSLEVGTVEAARLLAAASASDAKSREQFRTALLEASIEPGITGASGFDTEKRVPAWDMMLLTINRNGIFPIEQSVEPPETPAPSTP
jgi:branched-chain amino acid transport system substrate-binding protein